MVISRFALMEKSCMIAYLDGVVELVDLRVLTDEWLFFVDGVASQSGRGSRQTPRNPEGYG